VMVCAGMNQTVRDATQFRWLRTTINFGRLPPDWNPLVMGWANPQAQSSHVQARSP
jgi:hypothetical protein